LWALRGFADSDPSRRDRLPFGGTLGIYKGENILVGAVFLHDWRHAQSRMSWGVHEKDHCNYRERLRREALVGQIKKGMGASLGGVF
jgi:hypothetical protein